MKNASPAFIGFLAKKIAPRPDWLKVESAREICSLSNCISKMHPDAFAQWKHNRFNLYRTEALALEVIPEAERIEYTTFAYRLWPVKFDQGGQGEFVPEKLEGEDPWADELDWSGWERLGYDLVGMGMGGFECSPLSCNGYAAECTVNACCLIDDFDEATAIGKIFGDPASHVEPATYYLIEVWRKQ